MCCVGVCVWVRMGCGCVCVCACVCCVSKRAERCNRQPFSYICSIWCWERETYMRHSPVIQASGRQVQGGCGWITTRCCAILNIKYTSNNPPGWCRRHISWGNTKLVLEKLGHQDVRGFLCRELGRCKESVLSGAGPCQVPLDGRPYLALEALGLG